MTYRSTPTATSNPCAFSSACCLALLRSWATISCTISSRVISSTQPRSFGFAGVAYQGFYLGGAEIAGVYAHHRLAHLQGGGVVAGYGRHLGHFVHALAFKSKGQTQPMAFHQPALCLPRLRLYGTFPPQLCPKSRWGTEFSGQRDLPAPVGGAS